MAVLALVLASTGTSDPWLEAVVREHAPFVGRALRYLGVPERDLPDACQEVFLVVHRKRAAFAEGTSMKAWLRSIALGVARNTRRSERRRRESPEDAAPVAVDIEDPELALARRERRDNALALLETLSTEQREVLVLYEIEQLTMQEIVDMIGVPLQTGYSRLRLARTKLAAALAGGSEDR
ncbi:MAG: sigma-70 family RNA polymerase sigma factor [Sandaracinaceae bacterium]|nr:sigma-70 family RNA polymerase sigma factor [Sandaracinaceae bacterium]